MKVTIVVPGRWHAFDLAAGLLKAGVLHKIVTSYPKTRTRLWGVPNDKVVSLPAQLILTRLAWKLGGENFAMRLQFRLNDVFARSAARHIGCADLVHAWSGSAEPTLIEAAKKKKPTVLERSSAHMEEQCRILREEYFRLGRVWTETPVAGVQRELREYNLADIVAVPSLFVERSFLSRGYPAAKLNRNGFGVNVSKFTPGIKTDSVFRVIFAGSLSVRKGIGHLVNAFQLADLPDSALLLVGSSTVDTTQLVGTSDSRIVLTGHQPQGELVNYYRQASVFVMPSVEEGQAMVQFQALACGLPLICTESTGGEDLLARGGPSSDADAMGIREFPAGYVVPTGFDSAIAECLKRLHQDPDLLARKRSAALALRDQDISWERYARANLEMYRRVLTQARH
jgi:alpha-maltose-1-phosphate synthase